MKSKIFAAVAVAAIAFASTASAQGWDPANSPSDLQIQRQALKGSTSGSAVATSGSFTAGPQVWDPANSPRDIELEARGNALKTQAPADFTYRAPVWDPAND
ncbi:hypothetical protein [Chthonobacter albigriseus]|uniref:hypothetical protein n=1 Tax=Chthonobacter albigriseus TaxID=1683161 RepID=UPI0015EFD046|nr:hypothetical protein [Chthonobacter albigriseus]